jgi:DNA polymerase III epsilon subunit-like protein
MPIKYVKQPKFGLALDTETSGAIWGELGNTFERFQVLSWGLIIFEMETLKEVETAYLEVKFNADDYEWTKSAENVHGLSIEHLEQNGITEEEAAIEIASLLLKYFGPNDEIMMLGHNVDFDIKGLKHLMKKFGIELKISHRKFDTVGAGWIALGVYNSNELFDVCGFSERGAHNALEDIRMTLDAARTIRELVQTSS